MGYLIGDTIRLKATIKDLDGNESEPASLPTVAVYKKDGTQLLAPAEATKVGESTAQYYYDWKINGQITAAYQTLTAVWSWDDKHKKRIKFRVQPIVK